MEIILMRHGRPGFTGAPKVKADEMAIWISHYDASDTGSDRPPERIRQQSDRVLTALSSPLPRALSSLAMLNLQPVRVDEVFREAELPVYMIPAVKLSPYSWVVFFRLLWLCGLSKEVESLAMAKKRARRAAEILVKHATVHSGPVLLMGHGIMNRLIAKELISLGWKQCTRAGKGYWGADFFSLDSR
ncbi:histidine phosphatase family protein [Erwiniaceae bacterium CAU 1747]